MCSTGILDKGKRTFKFKLLEEQRIQSAENGCKAVVILTTVKWIHSFELSFCFGSFIWLPIFLVLD